MKRAEIKLVALVSGVVDFVVKRGLSEELLDHLNAYRPSGLLEVAEAADYLRISPATLRNWIRQGLVAHVRCGRRVLLLKSDLDAFIQESRQVGQGEGHA